MRVLVVTKPSKYEWDKLRLTLSHREVMEKYISEHANVDVIMAAHEYQLRVRKLFEAQIKSCSSDYPSMIMMSSLSGPISDFSPKKTSEYGLGLVVVLGGDNSFTYVSRYVGDVPILGVNSDPERSDGYLTQAHIHRDSDVDDVVQCIQSGNLHIEQWARLKVVVKYKLHAIPPLS